MVTIKTAQPADAHALAVLAREIWQEHYTDILGEQQVQYMLDTIQSQSAIKQDLENGKLYWLVQVNGQNAGYVSYELLEDQLFLSKFYLNQTARGKGVGRFLFEELKKIAFEQNKKSIGLTVNKYNAPTIAVYQKMGFEKVREQVADIGNGFVMDDYVLNYII
ncbi:GNAT family N-acetyltransferase [Desemzia sp. RIT804]|uniref:GNAT family N-acetyltransferase n=1 Tax=Desemzia sp. RIT 804 TaxID=2810209 RepID=UPI00194E5EDF|nr:GNAT family N-acetyltransferase [Desemzia sp. RIT 804]MBM6615435.1 GNAT family N-acetyltransferase [Desemzia sp. RIT 804]